MHNPFILSAEELLNLQAGAIRAPLTEAVEAGKVSVPQAILACKSALQKYRGHPVGSEAVRMLVALLKQSQEHEPKIVETLVSYIEVARPGKSFDEAIAGLALTSTGSEAIKRIFLKKLNEPSFDDRLDQFAGGVMQTNITNPGLLAFLLVKGQNFVNSGFAYDGSTPNAFIKLVERLKSAGDDGFNALALELSAGHTSLHELCASMANGSNSRTAALASLAKKGSPEVAAGAACVLSWMYGSPQAAEHIIALIDHYAPPSPTKLTGIAKLGGYLRFPQRKEPSANAEVLFWVLEAWDSLVRENRLSLLGSVKFYNRSAPVLEIVTSNCVDRGVRALAVVLSGLPKDQQYRASMFVSELWSYGMLYGDTEGILLKLAAQASLNDLLVTPLIYRTFQSTHYKLQNVVRSWEKPESRQMLEGDPTISKNEALRQLKLLQPVIREAVFGGTADSNVLVVRLELALLVDDDEEKVVALGESAIYSDREEWTGRCALRLLGEKDAGKTKLIAALHHVFRSKPPYDSAVTIEAIDIAINLGDKSYEFTDDLLMLISQNDGLRPQALDALKALDPTLSSLNIRA